MLDQCPHCEKPYIDSMVDEGRCPLCGEELTPSEQNKSKKSKDLETFSPLMENSHLGFLARFWGTVAQVLFRPSLFFQALSTQGTQSRASEPAYLFGIICLLAGQSMSAYWVMQLSGHSLSSVLQTSGEQALWAGLLGIENSPQAASQITYFIHLASVQAHVEFILAPIIALFALHLWAGGCFGLSRFFKANPESASFDATLRWVAYAQAPFILAVIPSIGALIATGWVGILLIRGLVVFHQMRFLSSLLMVLSLGSLLKVLWSGVLHRICLQLMALFFPHLT